MSKAQKSIVGIVAFGIVVGMGAAVLAPKQVPTFEHASLWAIAAMMFPAAIAVFLALGK